MELGLKGKVAALGGSTSGIGFACAQSLLQEGARVCICGRDETRLEKALESLKLPAEKSGGEVSGVRADLSKEAGVDRFLTHTRNELGPVDVLLVNRDRKSTRLNSSHYS